MWCGMKFTPGHTCVRSQIYQILVKDLEAKEGEMEKYIDCPDTLEELGSNVEEFGALHTISMQALIGTDGHQTMRLTGKVKNQSLVILVDIGSTHNFLDQAMAKRLNCDLHDIPGLKVTIANGEMIQTHELCHGLK